MLAATVTPSIASNDGPRSASIVRDSTVDAGDELLVRIANSDSNVLIQGETGTARRCSHARPSTVTPTE